MDALSIQRASIGSSGTVVSITRVSETDVDLLLLGTNIERLRVPVDDLQYLDALKEPDRSDKPAKHVINLKEVRERIRHRTTKQHRPMQMATSQFSKST
jgi:hypothetical protein